MKNNNDKDLIDALCALPNETPWLEFKANNFKPDMIGEDISALANSAALSERSCSYMIWGIDDTTHAIIGTTEDLQSVKVGDKEGAREELSNWLTHMLSSNTEFSTRSVDYDGNTVFIIEIQKPLGQPSTFKKEEYIRVGSYTRKLRDLPAIKAQLWDRLRNTNFEMQYAKQDLTLNEAFGLIDYAAYFKLRRLPLPSDNEGIAHYLLEENILARLDNGKYAITNLGGITLARNLSSFSRLDRKAIRIVQYDGSSRVRMLKEVTLDKGYAVCMEEALTYIYAMTPTSEDIKGAYRETEYAYPPTAIREVIANAMIHQDLTVTGTGTTIEIFDTRIEVTNPGTPLVDINRIIDNPPKSRNEKLSRLMRRFNLCEELGTGWDKIVIATEAMQLPAPRMVRYTENTRVVLYSAIPFTMISREEKLRAVYQHASIRYLQDDAMTNKSLRERFGLADTYSASISRLIKEAVKEQIIKPLDDSTSNRYIRYIPAWA